MIIVDSQMFSQRVSHRMLSIPTVIPDELLQENVKEEPQTRV